MKKYFKWLRDGRDLERSRKEREDWESTYGKEQAELDDALLLIICACKKINEPVLESTLRHCFRQVQERITNYRG